MTVIWSNHGDNDTALLENIWKGIDGVNVVELNKETKDIDWAIISAILAENDTLVFAGHGSRNGLFNPSFDDYAFSAEDVGFVKAKNVFCIWCNAYDFCVDNDLQCLATSMFISNVDEAMSNCIESDAASIDRCNLQFYAECNHCLREGMSMRDMYSYLVSRVDDDSEVDRFNRGGLGLVGKSLGDVVSILCDFVKKQKSIPPEYAQLVNDNFWDLVGHSSETDVSQSDVNNGGAFDGVR